MHPKSLAALNTLTLIALAPLALAQSGMTSKPSVTATASNNEVVTMMWDNQPTAAAVVAASDPSTASDMSGMSMDTMTMSNGGVMSGMSMSMTRSASATGTAMAGMNMTGSAGRTDLMPGVIGAGWVVVGLGAGIGFLAGTL